MTMDAKSTVVGMERGEQMMKCLEKSPREDEQVHRTESELLVPPHPCPHQSLRLLALW